MNKKLSLLALIIALSASPLFSMGIQKNRLPFIALPLTDESKKTILAEILSDEFHTDMSEYLYNLNKNKLFKDGKKVAKQYEMMTKLANLQRIIPHDNQVSTLSMEAAKKAHPQIAILLLQCQAPAMIHDDHNFTALDYVRRAVTILNLKHHTNETDRYNKILNTLTAQVPQSSISGECAVCYEEKEISPLPCERCAVKTCLACYKGLAQTIDPVNISFDNLPLAIRKRLQAKIAHKICTQLRIPQSSQEWLHHQQEWEKAYKKAYKKETQKTFNLPREATKCPYCRETIATTICYDNIMNPAPTVRISDNNNFRTTVRISSGDNNFQIIELNPGEELDYPSLFRGILNRHATR